MFMRQSYTFNMKEMKLDNRAKKRQNSREIEGLIFNEHMQS